MYFGTWMVVAGVEQERFQFHWDGRTLALTISQSLLIEGRVEWSPIYSLNAQHPEAMATMEQFLYEKFVTKRT